MSFTQRLPHTTHFIIFIVCGWPEATDLFFLLSFTLWGSKENRKLCLFLLFDTQNGTRKLSGMMPMSTFTVFHFKKRRGCPENRKVTYAATLVSQTSTIPVNDLLSLFTLFKYYHSYTIYTRCSYCHIHLPHAHKTACYINQIYVSVLCLSTNATVYTCTCISNVYKSTLKYLYLYILACNLLFQYKNDLSWSEVTESYERCRNSPMSWNKNLCNKMSPLLFKLINKLP